MVDVSEKKYLVGISFRSPDWATAHELSVRLARAPSVTHFYSEDRQEEIAGRGTDKFKQVFSKETLLNVVLFQETWGKTEATKAEMEGIIDSAMRQHWNNLLFYRLDTSPLPSWYPNGLNYLSLVKNPLDQLESAIRSKVDELRDETSSLSLIDRAHRLAKERADVDARERMMQTGTGVEQVIQEFRSLCVSISEHVATLLRESGTAIAGEYDQFNMVIRDSQYSYKLTLIITQRPSVEGSYLQVESVNAQIRLPSRGRTFLGEPSISKVAHFEPDYVPNAGWLWKNKTTRERKHTSALAEWIVASFLDYLRPEIRKPPMSIFPFNN